MTDEQRNYVNFTQEKSEWLYWIYILVYIHTKWPMNSGIMLILRRKNQNDYTEYTYWYIFQQNDWWTVEIKDNVRYVFKIYKMSSLSEYTRKFSNPIICTKPCKKHQYVVANVRFVYKT